jgi:SAM-dependent methyltransferase
MSNSRIYIDVPQRKHRPLFGTALHALAGIVLSPLYWIAAALRGGAGVRFRIRCCALGLRALFAIRNRLRLETIFHLLFMPMESTRYFEFEFAWSALEALSFERMLDVSSPRLLPLCVIEARAALRADLINPDPRDLADTARLVAFIGADQRAARHACVVTDAPFPDGHFDLITSLSVLEHIPDDGAAVAKMWQLLKPGGVLILTLPCMAKAQDQFISQDQWGVLRNQVDDGYVFWQRLYDRQSLEERIFRITGAPQQIAVYGEKIAGAHQKNSRRKRADAYYPYWKEPYMMATDYRLFDRLEELPGEGVVGLRLVKPR